MAIPWAFDTLPVSVAAGGQSLAQGVLRTHISPLHTLDIPWRLKAQASVSPESKFEHGNVSPVAIEHLFEFLFSNEKLWSEELKDPGQAPTAPLITPVCCPSHFLHINISYNHFLSHKLPKCPPAEQGGLPFLQRSLKSHSPRPRCSPSTSSLSTSLLSFYTAMMT